MTQATTYINLYCHFMKNLRLFISAFHVLRLYQHSKLYPPLRCFTPARPDNGKWLFDKESFIQNYETKYTDYHIRTCTELHCHSSGWGRKEKIKVVTAGIEFRILFIVTKCSYVKWQDYYSLFPHFFR